MKMLDMSRFVIRLMIHDRLNYYSETIRGNDVHTI